MKRWAKGFAILILLFPALSLLPSALADSALSFGTFTLAPGKYIQFSIELQKNDRFEGNFTVSNLLPYKPIVTMPWGNNSIHSYSIDVTMIMSNPYFNKPYTPQKILDFSGAKGNFLYFFNWTADRSSSYLIIFYCSTEYFPQDAKIPQITFNYNVRENNPLKINILSPLNQTYEESSIPLNFTVSRANSMVTYSLDRKDNATLDANTTLTGLSDGIHTATVYANDTFGYSDNQSVTFRVEPNLTIESGSIIWFVVAFLVFLISLAAIMMVLYRRHRKLTILSS